MKGPELQLTVHYRHTCQHFCFYLEFSFVLLVYAGLVHSYIWGRNSNSIYLNFTAPLKNIYPLPPVVCLFLKRCRSTKKNEGHKLIYICIKFKECVYCLCTPCTLYCAQTVIVQGRRQGHWVCTLAAWKVLSLTCKTADFVWIMMQEACVSRSVGMSVCLQFL